jgi:hypothetical protein
MVNTTSLSLGSPLESPGHGRWVRTGPDTYDVTFFTVSADAAGNHILTSKVRGKLRLSADGNEFTGVFQVDVFDPNGGFSFQTQAPSDPGGSSRTVAIAIRARRPCTRGTRAYTATPQRRPAWTAFLSAPQTLAENRQDDSIDRDVRSRSSLRRWRTLDRVPDGISFDGNSFVRTAATAPAFSYLRPIETGNEGGGPDRDRTGDLVNAIHARSQLRYWPTLACGRTLIVPCRSAPIKAAGRTVVRSPRANRRRPAHRDLQPRRWRSQPHVRA